MLQLVSQTPALPQSLHLRHNLIQRLHIILCLGPKVITVANVNGFAIQFLLANNKEEVVLGNFPITDFLW
jgi:hypothetical protein